MGIVSTKELSRTFEREVGRAAIVKRHFVCVLDDDLATRPTEIQIVAEVFSVASAANIVLFGLSHPTLAAWKLRKVWINEGYEGSPYHIEVVGEYGVVRDDEVVTPINRAATWSVDGQMGEYPALYYYSGAGNGTRYPLTNSAYDYFPGLMTTEAMFRITTSKNFATFPTSWTRAMNHVNSDTWWGCSPYQVRVDDVDVTYEYEEFGGVIVKYWKATAVLVWRASGHNMQLPDIGWNFIDGGQKRRAMVFDFNNAEWVASANPVGLDGYGNQTGGQPAILNLRVNPEVAFTPIFGTPPT